MNIIHTIGLLAELEGEHCGLNHGPQTNPENYPACDYIVIPFGDIKTAIQTPDRNLVIPVCLECAQALADEEWTLLYCFECNASQWVYREMTRNRYRHHILWLKGCPSCSNAFGGLYFNEARHAAHDVVYQQAY